MNIHESIKQIRQRKSISQQAIAAALGVDVAVISRIECGARPLKVPELGKIAAALGVSVVDLITYPKKYVERDEIHESPLDVVLQIRLSKDQADQVLHLVFGGGVAGTPGK